MSSSRCSSVTAASRAGVVGPDHREVVDDDGDRVPHREAATVAICSGLTSTCRCQPNGRIRRGEVGDRVEAEPGPGQQVDPDAAHPEPMQPGDLGRGGVGRDDTTPRSVSGCASSASSRARLSVPETLGCTTTPRAMPTPAASARQSASVAMLGV